MDFTEQEVRQYVEQEDVRFIRLAFCDVFGKQKNIAILPTELDRAFRHGIAIDASAMCAPISSCIPIPPHSPPCPGEVKTAR